VEAHMNLADALASQGKLTDAVDEYRKTLGLRPDWPPVLAKLAWILATDARVSDPRGEAVQLAERLCARTGCKDARVIDVLAATYASVGRFDDAVATAEKAVAQAKAVGEDAIAKLIGERLQLYRAGRPYRAATP